MADLSALRRRHAELIFMCRAARERWGQQAVDALAECHMKAIREAFARKAAELGSNDLAAFVGQMTTHPETHTREEVRSDEGVYEMKITRCAHAEIFAEWNARDIGLQFVCGGDVAMIEGFNPAMQLRRPKLLMRGDDCCRLIYTME
ncbi:MAG TPA: L-2-amino-thiazoline-4-carboxylic acid hydrolase [Phycisphaerae bacterium]|nr:L-2-amino-thiazoline-4-carboxylic acid hydrolase [Phycisphaerae bacterium]